MNNTAAMTPLRTKAAIEALSPLGRVYASTAQTITSAGLLTLPHGLPSAPELVVMSLVCVTADHGWAPGDVVFVGDCNTTAGANRSNTVYVDATNVYVRFSVYAECFVFNEKTTGSVLAMTNASWTLRVRAWA